MLFDCTYELCRTCFEPWIPMFVVRWESFHSSNAAAAREMQTHALLEAMRFGWTTRLMYVVLQGCCKHCLL